MYVDGIRPTSSGFVRISPNLTECVALFTCSTFLLLLIHDMPTRDILTIKSLRSSIVASICRSMPENLRADLMDGMTACFEPGALQELDTAKEGGDHIFQAVHFSWYNRHFTTVSTSWLLLENVSLIANAQWVSQGSDAPQDAPPMKIRRTGGLKTNYHQFLPYPSKDMTNSTNQSIYQCVKNILSPLFEWLSAQVRR